jgi:NAD-dependent deacetylase
MNRSLPPAERPAIDAECVTRLRAARHVAVLTGAGVSAESGIPTFRDALTGLWARYRPEDLATPEAFVRDPALVWAWYEWRHGLVSAAAPNPAHLALARLQALAPRFTLVTQNVDGLHQRAGSTGVWELHGSLCRVRCSRGCAERREWPAGSGGPPPCPGCGSPLRPDVVWFGEPLPREALAAAWDAARACDVFLSVGTSNLVEPAASIPWVAAGAGALVIVVNPETRGQRTGPGVRHLVGSAGALVPELVDRAFGNVVG